MNIRNVVRRFLTLSLLAGSLAVAPLSAQTAAAGFDVRPVPLKTPPPIYPDVLRRDGVDGIVAVKVTIDENGSVSECVVSKSSRVEFEQPAVDAVKNWKFKPASKDGVAVKSQVVIPIKFIQES